jgi:ornithine carbamoyltransferase
VSCNLKNRGLPSLDEPSARDIGFLLEMAHELKRTTGNAAVNFLHCLPSFHDRRTRKGEELYRRCGMDGLEVTDEAFESPGSVVFDQAENRLHTTKALPVATLA